MKQTLRIWAAAMALMVSMPAAGVSALALGTSTATISNTAKTSTAAVAYDYQPFDEKNSSKYINEVSCETTKLTLQGDNSAYYRITDLAPFVDNKNFITTVKRDANPDMIKSIKTVTDPGRRQSEVPSFAIRLSESAVLDDVYLGFETLYTAKRDVTLSAIRTGTTGSSTESDLVVKSGAKITVTQTLLVNYDKLNLLQFSPKYNTSFDQLVGSEGSAGVEGDSMYPQTDKDSDYTWESLGVLCAEVETGSASVTYAPKLSAFWRDAKLLTKFGGKNAYIRSFGSCTISGKVDLILTNPYLNFDGDETVPHKDVYIYEYVDGKAVDVTSKFIYTQNSDGDGAFKISTDHLGTYIFADDAI